MDIINDPYFITGQIKEEEYEKKNITLDKANIISDKKWDEWAKELLALQNQYPEISKQVDYYEAFKDWDASTGAFLPLKDEWVVRKAKQLLRIGKVVDEVKPKKSKVQTTLF